MTNPKFKPKTLEQQTIVFHGNLTSIALECMNQAAARGSKIIFFGRGQHTDSEFLKQNLVTKNSLTFVSTPEELISVSPQVDTWINFGGKTGFGYLLNSLLDEQKQVFEENFWNPKEGSHLAIQFLKLGGTIINMGSEISVSAQPLLAMYSSAKGALKIFTESLRSELRDINSPIEVSLVRPTIIDRPISELNSYTEVSQEAVQKNAEAILDNAESPHRDVYIGGPARLTAIIDTFFPEVKDIMAETRIKELKNEAPKASGMSVFKALKTNIRSSLKENRKEDGH